MLNYRRTAILVLLIIGFTASSTATIAINGSRLDMNQNQIQDFFDTTSCGQNEAVTRVYANGSYQCGQAGGGLPTVLDIDNSANGKTINDVGSLIMSGDIDLGDNNIIGDAGSEIEASVFSVNSFLSLEGNSIENINSANFQSGISIGGGATPTIDMSSGYLSFQDTEGTLFHFGGGSTPDAEATGLHLETGTNPSSGDPILVVESSGGSERLRVEHDGQTSTSNSFDAGGDITTSGDVNANQNIIGFDFVADDDVLADDDVDVGGEVRTDDVSANDFSQVYFNDDINLVGNNLDDIGTLEAASATGNFIFFDTSDEDFNIESDQTLVHVSDKDGTDGGPYFCNQYESTGNFVCDGSKNWVHPINTTHKAVYSAQESGNVRAVWDTTVEVTPGNPKVVDYPKHFKATISEKPDIIAHATPHSLATVAVTERTDTYVVVEADAPTKVDLTVKGIREGFTDKQIVRPTNRTVTLSNGTTVEAPLPKKYRKPEVPGMGEIPDEVFGPENFTVPQPPKNPGNNGTVPQPPGVNRTGNFTGGN